MSKNVQMVRLSSTDAAAYVGLEGQIIVELNSFQIRVCDGVTPGGFTTLTLATAEGLFVTQEDFDTDLAAFEATLTAANQATFNTIQQLVFIARAPVIDIIATPPGSPANGDRYLVAHSGVSGVFVGQQDQVTEFNSATNTWAFSGAPLDGHEVFVQSDQTKYFFHSGTGIWDDVDPSLAALVTTVAANMTSVTASLALKAPLDSPAFTGEPTAPTLSFTDNSTNVATTAFARGAAALIATSTVDAAITALNFADNLATTGHKYIPGPTHDFLLQWGQGAADPANGDESAQTVTFDVEFPTQCLGVVVCTRVVNQTDEQDAYYQLAGTPTQTNFETIRRITGTNHTSTTIPFYVAFGY